MTSPSAVRDLLISMDSFLASPSVCDFASLEIIRDRTKPTRTIYTGSTVGQRCRCRYSLMNPPSNDVRVYGTLPSDLERHAGKVAATDEIHPPVSWLLHVRKLVLAFWICLTVLSLPFVPTIFDRMNFEPSPRQGSELRRVRQLFDASFPDLAEATPLVVMISCQMPCETVLDDFALRALQEMSGLFVKINERNPGLISAWKRPSSLAELKEEATARQTVQISADLQTLIWLSSWTLPQAGQARMMDAVSQVHRLADKLNREASKAGHSIILQGPPAIKEKWKTSTEHEFFTKDILTVPFALGIFLYQVPSWRLALLAAACIVMSISIGLASLVLILNEGVHINYITPLLMLLTSVAMSVDYAILIMSRFAEELQSGRRVEAALSVALMQSGGTVALSGCILVLCYACVLIYPGDMIYTLAIGANITLILCLFTSLTFTPCAVAAFPEFFTRSVVGARPDARRGSRGWFKVGAWLTRWPFSVVVPLVVYACMLPAIFQLAKFHTSDDLRSYMPHDLLDSYARLQTAFPGTGSSPILLYLDSAGQGVKSDSFFDQSCAVLKQMVKSSQGTDHRLELEAFKSILLAPVGQLASFAANQRTWVARAMGSCPAVVCLRWSSSPLECPFLPSARDLLEGTGAASQLAPGVSVYYRRLWASLVSSSNSSSAAVLSTRLPSGAEKQRAWEAIEQSARRPMYSGDMLESDIMRADYRRFPLVMALSLGAMFALISGSFKAALVPIKLFLTVVAPLAFVFGVLLTAYELGGLDWLSLPHVNADFGLSWVVPIVTLPVLTGLAVDYDVFLFSRAYELRRLGFDNHAAVVGALATTGPVISGAGLAMAIAFCGMMLSDIQLNNEIGFVLSFGVLLDTFVVRTLLAPSMLVLGGSLNFWPQALPDASRTIEDMEDWLCRGAEPCDSPVAAATASKGDGMGTPQSSGPSGAAPASSLLGAAHP
mmetsp:Transcript_121060/g.302102  ORF Transcript_121060/g.302102 Transcript_121060/m.302102 type:complete len:950 (+) Transcript_121060:263-3112(+)